MMFENWEENGKATNRNCKLIEEKIEELYNSLMDRPLRVLGIFNDFFGEDKVDMQGYWSLDKFKSWMNIEPLSTYIPDGNIVSMNMNDWSMYKTGSITDLPGDQVEKVVNVLTNTTVKERIGNAKFNGIFILVHFPHVRVTNEHDRFVDINHLWAKVKVSYNGTLNGGFTLNRSEYTLLHIRSHYMHSHISSIPTRDFTQFQNPCTGSGPINGTISALNRDYDEDMWNMFCLELSKYVTVESVAGRPYHYLEKLGTSDMEAGIDSFKIEGRMKTALYVATVARTYRKAIDDYLVSREQYEHNIPCFIGRLQLDPDTRRTRCPVL